MPNVLTEHEVNDLERIETTKQTLARMLSLLATVPAAVSELQYRMNAVLASVDTRNDVNAFIDDHRSGSPCALVGGNQS